MMWHEYRRFFTVIVVAAMGMAPPVASLAATTFTVNPPADRTDATAKGMASWCDRAASATQGRIHCAAADMHIRDEDAAAALQAGKVDLISFSHKTDPRRYRISRIADLPLLGDFAETTSVAYQRVYEKTPLMAQEHKGYKVLAVFTQPPAFLFTSQSGSANASHGSVLIGTTTEVGALPGHKKMRTAIMFKGGIANVSYVFALNQDTWNRLSEKDRAALDRISGVEAAGLLGRMLDAEAWRANIGMHDADISFQSPAAAILAQYQKEFAAAEKRWIAQARSAGIKHPASMLAAFRKGILQQDDAE
ncbi:hypothetical protein [Duganella phyllosphaerae]|uniref:Bacterial extracellular solute-binding protein, family 7 n=1 Tax=Duganella phyllosphaerae TaxID=762836 RepID=A0A1E7WWE8_9BURK|nr:hypothetical protein [Duganella phyllosphaerae]OFA03986.1 bacterial extracellular solute-binding protein, family 7 [Duganella phyllosphaerae]